MRTLVLMALFGGDADHASAWQAWLKVQPLVCDTDGGCHVGCRDGTQPQSAKVDGRTVLVCR